MPTKGPKRRFVSLPSRTKSRCDLGILPWLYYSVVCKCGFLNLQMGGFPLVSPNTNPEKMTITRKRCNFYLVLVYVAGLAGAVSVLPSWQYTCLSAHGKFGRGIAGAHEMPRRKWDGTLHKSMSWKSHAYLWASQSEYFWGGVSK